MKKTVFLITLLIFTAFVIHLNAQDVIKVRLDGNSAGRVFEGIGAVSAGASSRLLADYPEPARSHVLDYLFKPKFGAAFQHLKVELGCGENSTCGSEPSHAYNTEELVKPVDRGYELWLASEARKRNPRVILDCLPWGYPGFLPGKFTQSSADWFVSFLDLARDKYNMRFDWVGAAQNEWGTDLDWIVNTMRPTLDRHGYRDVNIQGPELWGEHNWKIFNEFDKKPNAAKFIDAVCYHYVNGREPWSVDFDGRPATEKAKDSGKPLWAGEEWSTYAGRWDSIGALYVARLINKLYIRDQITKVQFWTPFDGIYNTLDWHDTGFLQADQPWSGYYEIWPALWAVAHTTQFTEPGWPYLDSSCGRFSESTWKGSYVTLRSPSGNDWSMIITTGNAVTMEAEIATGLNTGTVHVWKSDEGVQFIEQKIINPKKGKFSIALKPNSIYTLTTTTGQHKGMYPAPTAGPFPFPYKEDFESCPAGSTPKYFADQKGTFEVADVPGYGRCLKQIVDVPGHTCGYFMKFSRPYTVIGDPAWKDYTISSDVYIVAGEVEIGGRFSGNMSELAYRLSLDKTGNWRLSYRGNTLASGWTFVFDASEWHSMSLTFSGNAITASIDGRQVAKVADDSAGAGMVCIVSSYYPNMFDNISIKNSGEGD